MDFDDFIDRFGCMFVRFLFMSPYIILVLAMLIGLFSC